MSSLLDWQGKRLCLLSSPAVRLLVDTQRSIQGLFVYIFFFLGSFFFLSFCLFLVLCFLIHLKHYHQINLPKVKFLFLIASQKPGWFLTAHVVNFWILHVTFIWSIFLVPGTLLSELPCSPNLISHSSPSSRLCTARDNSFLLLVTHLCSSSSYLRSSPLSALSSSFQVRCSERPPLPVPAQPALSNSLNPSCLRGWDCPGWPCIVSWFDSTCLVSWGLSLCLQKARSL